ncbi:MAG: hypothetical protein J2P52_05990 [Blastocatellia bacterium]|nr:hypothetical protein [Blastocatellia bacterium]
MTKAYKRAGMGLAFGALLWTAALLFLRSPEDRRETWIIPICAAALSALCFSRYNQYRK